MESRRGQSLVEGMVALSVIMVALLGALSLLSNSTALNRVISENYLGSYLAAEGIEVVKNILDHNAFSIANGVPGAQWNDDVCAHASGTYEVDYTTKNLANNRIGPIGVISPKKIRLSPTGEYSYSQDSGYVDTPFTRTISIQCEEDVIKVKSEVRWSGRGGSKQNIILEDRFYKWR